jgi:hypothetical protein
MARSQLTVDFTREPDWERLARALNVRREQLRLTQEGAAVERLWVATPLNDAWTSAARLAVQNGQIIVAEVRVFPNEPGRKRPEIWSAELLGTRAPVPPGGLTTAVLRQVSLVEPRRHARAALSQLHRYMRRPPNAESAFWRANPPETRLRRARAGGRDDQFYAKLATEYEHLSDPAVSRRPVADLAARHRVPRPQMRDMVREARERGLLTFFSQGRPGGSATPLAHKILKTARTKTPRRRR